MAGVAPIQPFVRKAQRRSPVRASTATAQHWSKTGKTTRVPPVGARAA